MTLAELYADLMALADLGLITPGSKRPDGKVGFVVTTKGRAVLHPSRRIVRIRRGERRR